MDQSPSRMSLLEQQLQQMIRLSKKIITELEKDKPSTEILNNTFNLRQHHINKMEKLIDGDESSLSAGEKKKLQLLFDEFDHLSERIREGLEETLDQYRDKVADATKRRKAEDGYQILNKPDISYF
ncbi:hypothetical protein NC796_17850 [Aliifodinibius sp. S!AR15-10]|uniref:hypothetical protein n=1 Tax=Aliifodinibius sp. S!AR15-10 TaxID=2950437 RepID=UPI002862D9B4|nr:hypothetical protein [Aliifodinibius sp. S!AR15-10]MDR8393025.1 hypothetical protein [Aliifodinibius sp. S!AR15-10]